MKHQGNFTGFVVLHQGSEAGNDLPVELCETRHVVGSASAGHVVCARDGRVCIEVSSVVGLSRRSVPLDTVRVECAIISTAPATLSSRLDYNLPVLGAAIPGTVPVGSAGVTSG